MRRQIRNATVMCPNGVASGGRQLSSISNEGRGELGRDIEGTQGRMAREQNEEEKDEQGTCGWRGKLKVRCKHTHMGITNKVNTVFLLWGLCVCVSMGYSFDVYMFV